jgi:crossover junction endodeoxyribonuclease RuvC
MIILGLDPSLSCTGWGVIRVEGSRISHVANGQVKTDAKASLPDRLAHLDTVLAAVIADHAPMCAAVEEVFVNDNPQSTLKLAHARGVVLLGCARAGLPVGEYAPRLVKKGDRRDRRRGEGTGAGDAARAVARCKGRRRRCRRCAGGGDLPCEPSAAILIH